ncbi:pilus assembly PilX N-terminal domain-containing protein [Rheinheimera soli]|uniref:MSHA biogenesis protein MshP n=1 Tax=Rheinheimera soli TaxID=443616 RepID=A0ABU1W2D2_9GAMM|nr:pilus assembly PilX N-terminal domain-containing protein [Rheinheimera soli]MDR7122116.1 MSHA biogenesis protein MshP [Rheinheimera soli]
MSPENLTRSGKLQQGSALVVAVFIIVVMLLLIGSLSKLLVSSTESVSYEVLGTRAFFAAQSGMEYGVKLLYPFGEVDSAVSVAACTGMAPLLLPDFDAAGLQSCSASISCLPSASPEGTIHFLLSSTGRCDGGSIQTSRTIEMEVWQ